MTLVVSLNPAWDLTYYVDGFDAGRVVSVRERYRVSGGKGANVSRVLRALGREVRLIGLAGARDIDEFSLDLAETGTDVDLLACPGRIRITVSVVDSRSGKVTEIREPGDFVHNDDVRLFLERFAEVVRGARLVILSGSLPPGMPPKTWGHMIGIARGARVPVFMDTSASALAASVRYHPSLVKPNLEEARAYLATDATPDLSPLRLGVIASERLMSYGAQMAVVSLGEAGAVMRTPEGVLHGWVRLNTPAMNPVGSGDAMMAGIAVGFVDGKPSDEWFRMGIASGAASSLCRTAGVVDPLVVRKLRQEVVIEQV